MNTSTDSTALPETFLQRLADIFPGEALLTDPGDCWTYGYDNSRRHALPRAVLFATRHEQVGAAVQLCNHFRIPLSARGRGTGTTGATVPLHNGVVLSLERMTKILEYAPQDRYISVEPGLTNQNLQERVRGDGFFWPPDPSSAAFCTIGGNLACNAAGPRAVKYGTPRENTLGLRAVTGAGQEIKTGVRTSKGVVGYDLTRLLLGSEGTLAIITAATLKLTPLAEATTTLRAIYASVADAAAAVAAIMAQPLIPCALEFIDGNGIALMRNHSAIELPDRAKALLLIEVDGPRQCLEHAARQISKAARNKGLLEIAAAKTATEVQTLWQTRKALAPALRKAAAKRINEDVVVPITNLPALIDGLHRLEKKHHLPIINFGHAGNGNLHVNLLLVSDSPEQKIRAQRCLDDLFNLVLQLDGTLSGEHGIGLEKRDFVDREIDLNSLDLMCGIKNQFDPNGILNPDKMLPPVD
ncbi:FAD-binding oxidoreductase [Thiolapillus sp.]|uniref:FAD-binding oxidoreductase n=1 Tax=Thiolapillus sp. TaxID=2017437 RepID=UPI003AF4E105